ncbi:butyrophilin-like protein 9 [Antechinus flavipes]|uniref:butyrophilin-like protein 9 n=1 Tax=Antechinus flavipes TaxID=38775 RepID=UPI002236209A|nr:butyrophilin-like protein 9 [Antechinus flavipes]
MQCLFLQDLSFVLLLLLPWPVSGKFTVIGPPQSVIAMVGGEAILPCHLSPQMDAQDMDVMWFYGESSLLVHRYKDRQDHLNHQHQEYKGRTEFLRDDISNGSVALKLRHIRPSDEGKYRCYFESSSAYGEAEYQVYVEGKFTVIGPQQPVIAMVGEEAIFPCHLSPQMDAQDMDVTWYYGESLELVHQYKYRQDYLNHQRQEYKGRTEFLRDDISTGSVALKLRHIRPSDEGKYWCLFESSRTYGEAEYQVYVAGKGSAPHIYPVNDENKSHRLVCTSIGWYPEPEVQWRKNQEMLLPQDTMIKKEENGLFSVETSITVSTNSTGNVSCFIWNPLLRQKLEASFSLSGKFTVTGPQQPVIAMVGGEAIFPCHLSPQMDAQDMDVMWFYGESSELVHHYTYRQGYLKNQHQKYKGRTEFLRDDISTGSVALKLHHIRPSDEGKYRCSFESSSAYEEAEYQVYVAGKGSAPHIYIMSDENKSLRLVCTSIGWYPKPEVQWRKNQETLLPQDTTIKKKENGLFSVETSITISMNSIVNVSCLIGNPLLRQKLEASFSLSDDLFTNDTPGIVIWIVIVALLSTVILILIFVIWKLKNAKGVNKEKPVSYVSVKLENECVMNEDELGVYKDSPVVEKEEPGVYKDSPVVEKEEPVVEKEEPVVEKEEPVSYDSVKVQNEYSVNKEEPVSYDSVKIQNEYDVYKDEPGMNEDQLDLQAAQKYRVDVTFDANTARPFLVPLLDRKSISSVSHKNNHKNIGGMETVHCVLGKERFTSGRHYWEVKVEDKLKWIMGLCKDSVIRKMGCPVTPGDGFWTISLKKKNEYWALSSPPTYLHCIVDCKVVGIFLDYEAGCISFYNVTDDSPICTFQDTFREALRAFLYPPTLALGKHYPYFHPPKAGYSQAL